jgi:hypothetical protein
MPRLVVALALVCVAIPVFGQESPIPWRTDPQQAVREAQASKRPLMVYVLASTKDRDNDVEREQKQALSSPRVLRLAQRFVPLRLSRSMHRDLLKGFGLPESANMMMSFVTPNGEVLGTLGAGGVAQVDSLAQKLAGAFDVYTKQLLDTEVKPKLANPEAKPAELKQALGLVQEFSIAAADEELIKLLERPRLDSSVRVMVCDTLAGLSTKTAINNLLELYRGGDASAAKALEKCTPAGAELLLSELNAEAEPFDYSLYKAVTQSCGIRNIKPARFFEKGSAKLKEQELDRIRKLVHDAAQRWKEAQG